MRVLLRNGEIQSGVLLLAVAGFFLIVGRRYEFGTFAMMGPGFVPRSLAILLAALGLALLVSGARSAVPAANPFASFALVPTIMVLGSIALFALLLPVLGYFVAAALLVSIGGMAASDRRPLEVAVSAIAIPALTGIVFVKILGLPMPLLPGWL